MALLRMKYEQLGEAINFYCIPKIFLGEAIANSLLADVPPMSGVVENKRRPGRGEVRKIFFGAGEAGS
jgi:hypothetical protein